MSGAAVRCAVVLGLVVLALVVASGCFDVDDGTSNGVPDTAAKSTAFDTPTPTPIPPVDDCPADEALCDEARDLLALLNAGDISGLEARMAPLTSQCPSYDGPVAGDDTFGLACKASPAGTVTGYGLLAGNGPARFVDDATFKDAFRRVLKLGDAFEYEVAAVGCYRTSASATPDCSEIAAIAVQFTGTAEPEVAVIAVARQPGSPSTIEGLSLQRPGHEWEVTGGGLFGTPAQGFSVTQTQNILGKPACGSRPGS